MVPAGILIFAAFVLAGCVSGGGGPVSDLRPPSGAAVSAASSPGQSYTLGSGDKLRVIVFGEDDLSGQFELDGNGSFSMPLIGQVNAAGLTVSQVEGEIASKLRQGYLRNPSVSVEVLNYRPFYIHGEVKSAGEYPYTNGLTLQNAVAKAGGYSYRANTKTVYIRRANETTERAYNLDQPVEVLPGDTIRVPERFF